MAELSDAEIEERYNQAILKADPSKLTDDELDLRLQLAEQKSSAPESNIKSWAKAATSALPFAGSVGGGLLGAPMGPVGMIGGAGLGAGLGESARQFIDETFLDEPSPEMGDRLKSLGIEAAAGMIGESAPMAIAKVAKPIVEKVGSSISRIPKKAIQTYLEKGKSVDKLIKEYGSDSHEAANAVRNQINNSVQSFRTAQNTKLEKALGNADTFVDIKPALEILETTKGKLHADIDADKIAKLQKEIDLITKIAPEGVLDLKAANSLKTRLQEAADYLEPGQFFRKKGLLDAGLERAAGKVRKSLNAVSPEVKEANQNLMKLRRVEKSMMRGLLKEGGPEAGLISAGTQESGRAARSLKQLGDVTGKNYIPDVEVLAAQRHFADPNVLTGISTGAAALPFIAGGAGYGMGDVLGLDPEEKAILGTSVGLLGSPMALKYGIKGARKMPRVIKNAPGYLGAKGLMRSEDE